MASEDVATPPARGVFVRAGLALQARWSGLLLCAVIALAASFIARLHGGPPVPYALLFGVSFHFLHDDARIRAGLALCSGPLLRLGVALLGVRITLDQMAALGTATVASVVVCVAGTILAGVWLARRLGMGTAQGVLSGGATAICGASAALAIAAVLPRSDRQDRFTVLVVAMVTALSTLAMMLYPLLAHALGLSDNEAGIFIGASIHDVAQVVAAGYLMGTHAGDTATIVKLLRVAMLVAVVAAVAFAFGARRAASPEPSIGVRRWIGLVPWFLWLFVALVLLRSAHVVPTAVEPVAGEVSRACLLLAIAALGVRTSLPQLLRIGWRPMLLLLVETLWLAAAVLLAIVLARAA